MLQTRIALLYQHAAWEEIDGASGEESISNHRQQVQSMNLQKVLAEQGS